MITDELIKESIKFLTGDRVQKWIRALRSGEYPRASNALKTDFGYCCLGVLCEISPEVERGDEENLDSFGRQNYVYAESKKVFSSLGLTPEFCKEIGVSRLLVSKLMNMNDSGLYTFKEIADILEDSVKRAKERVCS